MLDIGKETTLPAPKCYFSSTTLPSYLDPAQQPTKKAPFNLLHSAPYYNTLTFLSPTSSTLTSTLSGLATRYAKLQLTLLDLLTGDLFNKHIKTGNVLLYSTPLHLSTSSSSATFTLIDGILTILCDKASYERAGLQGTSIPDPHARKHGQSKYKTEMNLRLPSMLAGKKGFERLVRAARDVFTGEISWLFYDKSTFGVDAEDDSLGVSSHVENVVPETMDMENVCTPHWPKDMGKKAQDDVMEVLEWLTLAAISSPRIQQADVVDEIISRYEPPEESSPQNITKTSFTGFLPTRFVADAFAKAVITSQGEWFAVLVQGFGGNGEQGKKFVVLKTEDGRASSWDVEG
ncbi:hypothetical protein AUEXF2481DRAFT_40798 [Aureobasidium subglaciale EXF-2481]|uniref:Uncharacterized protein n=1 Tax=Aureobasidium subglaciale (strain EXF-2481) TaxID=1043005 RepID=A0A074YL51_AURSE|nr:uncharacterized protein AUEXF2481DRAFT_40798 [Aureobasidium subglaciale EXF-2481]KEQ94842.1 hypothetical protein AUEXF2481DRAFT_40798 [Aureobasidium subglaciale EXF-2481]